MKKYLQLLLVLSSSYALMGNIAKATPSSVTKAISFEQYSVPSLQGKNQNKAPLNLASHPYGKQFTSQISADYQAKKINFAAYYIVSLWGCGSGCVDGVLIDTRDGKIYDLPDVSGGNINQFKAHSRLYIRATDVIVNDDNLIEIVYSTWNEKTKTFDTLVKRKEPFTEKFYD